MTWNGNIVVDATLHGFDWTESNYAVPDTAEIPAAVYGLHQALTKEDSYRLTNEEFLGPWKRDELIKMVFEESNVDVACYHATPIWDFWKDGGSDPDLGFAIKEQAPGRVLVYAPVNPYEGKKALDKLSYWVEERGVDGLKTYAASYADRRTVPQPLDTESIAYPFIERAIDLGVKVIAVHKAMPAGRALQAPFNVHDVDAPAARYPEMNFEVVHSGFAFLEDTAMLVGRHSNVWANLEVTNSFAVTQPTRFAEIIGMIASWGGIDRVMFSTGAPLVHPQQTLQATAELEVPEHLTSGYGVQPITDEQMTGILGGNFLRLHSIDEQELRARLADDSFGVKDSVDPLPEPWSCIRS